MAHGDIKTRNLSETKSSSSASTMLAAAIAPPVAFTVYLVAMFSLLWWHRRRQSRMRPSRDIDGDIDGGDVESKYQRQHRPSTLAFAASVLDVPLSPAVDSSTPLTPISRRYSGVMAISPVTTSFSPTSTVGSPLNPQRLLLPQNPSPKPSMSRNSRFHISMPTFVSRRLSSSPNGNYSANANASGSGAGFYRASGSASEGGGASGSGYRHGRRLSRADPVLPRTPPPAASPTLRFNSNDMLAATHRRPSVPSIRQHILNSHNHGLRISPPAPSAAAAARLTMVRRTRTPPPPNSPLPPTPTPTTSLSAGMPSPSSPMPVMPALCMLPRPRFSTSSTTKDTARVRPLPPLPLHELSSPSQQQQPGLQSQLQSPQSLLPSPRSATTASPLSAQPIVLQPNRLYLHEKEQPPHSSSSISRPYPFSRLVGHRRQRQRDPDSPPPYTSQYLDST